ncbi:MAG: amino acid decarboxylase [Clostridia bacterium]|nr:amino acid decarboxylase [Clostridia bacterium]
MRTPVCDFVRDYAASRPVRMHMPGHKGNPRLGPEPLDITEIAGADELYRARGILRESEENAARLFGAARTLYSTEGSSQCVRAMTALALGHARDRGIPARLLAGRNAHQSLLSAAALLDAEIDWLYPEPEEGLLACTVTPEGLEQALSGKAYAAVYLTAPDYLGHLPDLRPLADVCHAHDTLLLVDNAHGAYLKFLPESRHPIDRGADLCCDSAHKTLACLTGAAYLHIAEGAPVILREQASAALQLFGSTSPSWLILQSLDRMNAELAGSFPGKLAETCRRLADFKAALAAAGWPLEGQEPLKLTLRPKAYGYTGLQLAEKLRVHGIEPEFADPDFVTLMPSPDTPAADWFRLGCAFRSIAPRDPLSGALPPVPRLPRVRGIREAMLGPREEVPIDRAEGRVLADTSLSCPPAVPVAVPGERLNAEAAACFRYYGISSCFVLQEK